MSNEFVPAVGDWYRDARGQLFEIVAYDEHDRTIEIQYFDAAVEELDAESWYELDLTPEEQPEDWSGPFDDLEADDFGDTEKVQHKEDWQEFVDEY